MRPIVDGLQETYDGQMIFVYLNAGDSADGQAIFESLGLPGHPSYVIFSTGGDEQFRSFGIVEDITLIDAIGDVLESNE